MGRGSVYSLRPQVTERLEHELAIIQQLELCRFSGGMGLGALCPPARNPCTGRGSVADLAVAVLFGDHGGGSNCAPVAERFSLERCQKPDIDLDFDYRYRDRVAAYVQGVMVKNGWQPFAHLHLPCAVCFA